VLRFENSKKNPSDEHGEIDDSPNKSVHHNSIDPSSHQRGALMVSFKCKIPNVS
jgi:hypothetical protein